MKTKWLVPVVCLVAFGCGKDPGNQSKIEDCSNGIDDDNNGLVDCEDSVCNGVGQCPVGLKECTVQANCLQKDGKGYSDYRKADDPMPSCEGNKCVKPATGLVDLKVSANTTAYAGTCNPIGTINIRFVKKAAVDGTPVTCTRLEAIAGGKMGNPTAIEDSKQFNLQAYEVARVDVRTGTCGGTFSATNVHATTGKDFIVWVELWSLAPNSQTGLPQGTRYGWACVESGPAVDPITVEDNNVRDISITMPPPQGLQ